MDQAQQLRNVTKMNHAEQRTNSRVVTVTSGKGGVGKSNISVNLAVQLRKQGKRVLILDADFGLANVEVMFGAIPKFNLSDFIYRGKNIREVITPGPLDIGFISGGSGIMGLNDLKREQIMSLVNAIEELNHLADYIIIDTGAGISGQVMEFVLASPEVILVSAPEPSSLTDSYSLLKTLYNSPNFRKEETTVHIVSNRVSSAEEGKAVFDKLNSVVEEFLHGSLNYLGMIPQDAALEKAVRQQKPVSMTEPNAKSSKAFEVLTGNLINGTHNQISPHRGIGQLFSNLLQGRKQENKSV